MKIVIINVDGPQHQENVIQKLDVVEKKFQWQKKNVNHHQNVNLLKMKILMVFAMEIHIVLVRKKKLIVNFLVVHGKFMEIV